ncbi:MAG TPA: Gfo/Idh/MocA family oxidoreductase [Vicinamibacteria bacterium]|nr:Gfo/Idh/MocA family oxidoreductase [Vicinamibacteria bacterium]
MDTRLCRWGILGTAHIARKNWQAIALAGNARLVAVASRSLERGRQFVAECLASCPLPEAPAALAGYAELVARPDVDAVYIPLPTGVRKQWVLEAAAAGKHVLVEKPVGVTADDVREMLAACARHGVQLMDGVMYLHSRRLEALRRTLDDGESVGEIRRIVAQFSFAGDEAFSRGDIRMHSGLEPHGCLGDLGWYTLGFALWVMNDELPTRVSGRLLAEAGRPDSPGKVPTAMSGELVFAGGASASSYCSFGAENQQWANVSGTRGFVHVPDFVLPFFGDETCFEVTRSVFETHGCDFDMRRRTREVRVAEYGNSHPSSQEVALFRDFSALVVAGRREPHWGEVALKTQQVLDAVRRSAAEGREVALG